MTVKSLGNHSKGFLGHGIGGHGIANVPVGMGWDTLVASEASDVYYLQLSSVVTGDINRGIFFQGEVPVSIDFTLCNPALAADKDPAIQASVLWANTLAVPANTITPTDVLFTVCRITFSAPGALYVGVR